jgi:hypothetical protein
MAQGIASDGQRASVLEAIAIGLAEAGQFDEAQPIVDSISSHCERARTLASMSKILTQAGQYEYARQVANKAQQTVRCINLPRGTRDGELSRVTVTLTQAGQHEHALQVAEDISDNWIRIQAIAKVKEAIVENFLQADQHEHALHALGLIQKYWYEVHSRDDLLALLDIVRNLIEKHSVFGVKIVEGITWVDDFLKQA